MERNVAARFLAVEVERDKGMHVLFTSSRACFPIWSSTDEG